MVSAKVGHQDIVLKNVCGGFVVCHFVQAVGARPILFSSGLLQVQLYLYVAGAGAGAAVWHPLVFL